MLENKRPIGKPVLGGPLNLPEAGREGGIRTFGAFGPTLCHFSLPAFFPGRHTLEPIAGRFSSVSWHRGGLQIWAVYKAQSLAGRLRAHLLDVIEHDVSSKSRESSVCPLNTVRINSVSARAKGCFYPGRNPAAELQSCAGARRGGRDFGAQPSSCSPTAASIPKSPLATSGSVSSIQGAALPALTIPTHSRVPRDVRVPFTLPLRHVSNLQG